MKKTYVSDSELKVILLALAKAGADKPKPGTALGDALIRFTTPPSKAQLKTSKH